MSTRSNTIWTFAITSVALFMVTLDNLVVTTALPVIRKDLTLAVAARVDGERLHAHLRGAAPDGRGARRPVRAPADVLGRDRDLHRRLRRARRSRRRATRSTSPARLQGVGGAIVMPLTLTILSAAVPAGAPRPRARRLGRDRRPRRRDRPARRRRRRRGHLVALDLLAQRADRARRSRRSRSRACAESHGPAGRLDLPGLGARRAPACSGSSGASCAPTRVGWSSPRSSARSSAGSIAARRCSSLWELRTPAPMLPMRFFRNRTFALDERLVAVHVLRDVRLDLPAGPVLPDRAGLLAAAGGPADPAVDGDADLHRADRRSALRPDRRPAAHGRRARAAGDRPRLDRGRLHADASRTASSSSRSRSRASAWRSSSRRSRTSCSAPVGRRRRARPRARTNAIRELGGVFGVAVLASIFAHYGGYARRPGLRRRHAPAVWVGARRRRRSRWRSFLVPSPARVRRTKSRSRRSTWPPRKGGDQAAASPAPRSLLRSPERQPGVLHAGRLAGRELRVALSYE